MQYAEPTRSSIARWRAARRVVLSAVILAGSLVTSAAVMYRVAGVDASAYHRITRVYTYSGIGVVIEAKQDEVVVRRVMANTPAHGELRRGTRLVSVEGTRPTTLEGWATAIRGAPGTDVSIEVDGPCKGKRTVTLTRDVVQVRY